MIDLRLNLLGDAVETDIALWVDGLCRALVCSSHCGHEGGSRGVGKLRAGEEWSVDGDNDASGGGG